MLSVLLALPLTHEGYELLQHKREFGFAKVFGDGGNPDVFVGKLPSIQFHEEVLTEEPAEAVNKNEIGLSGQCVFDHSLKFGTSVSGPA